MWIFDNCFIELFDIRKSKSKTFKSVSPEHIDVYQYFTTLFAYTQLFSNGGHFSSISITIKMSCEISLSWLRDSHHIISKYAPPILYDYADSAAYCPMYLYTNTEICWQSIWPSMCANNAFATEIQLHWELQIHKFAAHCCSVFRFVFCSVVSVHTFTFTIQFGGLFPPDYILMRLNS